LTYGIPELAGEPVTARRLLSPWTLHFAAPPPALTE